jgi:hypothetical protein
MKKGKGKKRDKTGRKTGKSKRGKDEPVKESGGKETRET